MTHSDTIRAMQAEREADAIRWTRINDLLAGIWRAQEKQVCGNQETFERVILDACKPVNKAEPVTIRDITRHAVRVAVAECGTQEAAAKRLDVNRGTIRKHLYAVIVLLISATCSFGQRGTLATKPVTSSLALPPALVSAPVKLSLTWDIHPGVDAWRVQVGPARGNWTSSFITLTNRFVLTNGQHYAVRSIAGAMESMGASLQQKL